MRGIFIRMRNEARATTFLDAHRVRTAYNTLNSIVRFRANQLVQQYQADSFYIKYIYRQVYKLYRRRRQARIKGQNYYLHKSRPLL